MRARGRASRLVGQDQWPHRLGITLYYFTCTSRKNPSGQLFIPISSSYVSAINCFFLTLHKLYKRVLVADSYQISDSEFDLCNDTSRPESWDCILRQTPPHFRAHFLQTQFPIAKIREDRFRSCVISCRLGHTTPPRVKTYGKLLIVFWTYQYPIAAAMEKSATIDPRPVFLSWSLPS